MENSQEFNNLSYFQSAFAPYFKKSVLRMCSTDPYNLHDLPESILDRYSNLDRNQFLVTIYPSGDMWTEENLYRFVDSIEGVSEKATGIIPMAIQLIKVFGRDGRNAVLLTLLIVFLLLWVDLRGIRYALMAMLPLAFGVFWMVGLINLSGMKLSYASLASRRIG
jgi:predicted RND superfamily exporter protein